VNGQKKKKGTGPPEKAHRKNKSTSQGDARLANRTWPSNPKQETALVQQSKKKKKKQGTTKMGEASTTPLDIKAGSTTTRKGEEI